MSSLPKKRTKIQQQAQAMQQHISFGLLVSLSNHGLSLDEFVLRLGEAFETDGFPGILSLILNVVDEALCLAADWLAKEIVAECFQPCCQDCRWELKDREERTIRTSVGKVEMRWRRLRCVSCGKSFVPLRQWLGLEKWQSKTTELEKLVVEVVSEQSYRRSSDHLDRIGQIPVPIRIPCVCPNLRRLSGDYGKFEWRSPQLSALPETRVFFPSRYSVVTKQTLNPESVKAECGIGLILLNICPKRVKGIEPSSQFFSKKLLFY